MLPPTHTHTLESKEMKTITLECKEIGQMLRISDVKNVNKRDDYSSYLFPISTTSQSSISNDMEIGAPVNGDASIDHHSTTTKSNTSVHKCRFILSSTFPPYKNAPIIRMKRKTGLVRKKNNAKFV